MINRECMRNSHHRGKLSTAGLDGRVLVMTNTQQHHLPHTRTHTQSSHFHPCHTAVRWKFMHLPCSQTRSAAMFCRSFCVEMSPINHNCGRDRVGCISAEQASQNNDGLSFSGGVEKNPIHPSLHHSGRRVRPFTGYAEEAYRKRSIKQCFSVMHTSTQDGPNTTSCPRGIIA